MEDSQSSGHPTPLLSASMVELKAELSRKKAAFQQEKLSNINAVRGRKFEKISLKKKANVWDSKNRGVSERAQKDHEESIEEVDELLKSRTILEEKTKIYNAFASSKKIPEDDGSEGYLVDFQRKAVESIVEEREKARRDEEAAEGQAERKALDEPIPEPENSDEEWVDYTDSLGRSKRCLRKDLKDLQKMDKDLKKSLREKVGDDAEYSRTNDSDDSKNLHLMSSDMYREKMRQKWEAETRELVEKGQEEIHYSNVQYDEIRTHGVGFFQFSKDQQEREIQMEELNKLREKTKDERSRKEKIKDKRKALMEARLAKVKERRKLKTKETTGDDEEAEIGPKLSEADMEEKKKEEELKRLKEEEEKLAEEARKKHVREWDKKKKVASSWMGDKYVDNRRAEREAEFAPPSIYYSDSKNLQTKQSSAAPPDNHRKIFGQSSKHIPNKMKENNDEKSSAIILSSEPISSPNVSLDSIPLPSMPEHQSSSAHCHPQLDQQPPFQYQYSQYQGVNPGTNIAANVKTNVLFPMQNSASVQFQNTAVTPSFSNPQIPWQCQQQHQHYDVSTSNSHFPMGGNSCVSVPSDAAYNYSYSYNSQSSSQPQIMATTTTTPHPASSNTNISSYKRPSSHNNDYHNESSGSVATKKPKVPKSTIIDNRFILNADNEPMLSCETESFIAVPYKPGSFTEAKFKPETPDETIPLSRGKTEISGGPVLYKREDQNQGKEKEKSSDNDAEEKVEAFLNSIRNETT